MGRVLGVLTRTCKWVRRGRGNGGCCFVLPLTESIPLGMRSGWALSLKPICELKSFIWGGERMGKEWILEHTLAIVIDASWSGCQEDCRVGIHTGFMISIGPSTFRLLLLCSPPKPCFFHSACELLEVSLLFLAIVIFDWVDRGSRDFHCCGCSGQPPSH